MTLACEGVKVRAGGKTLVHGATAEFRPGRLCAILGPNGAGKSTLLSVLTGQRKPDEGRVLLAGEEVSRMKAADLALVRAVMPQESAVAFEFTAREVAELGRYPHRRNPSRREREIVGEALEATGVGALADRIFNTLSGGEKARVHLARALAQVWEPQAGRERWLLLDEPTAALDLQHQHLAMRLLGKWAGGQGLGVIAVLHDVNLALKYADDALLMPQGEAAVFGKAAEVLTQPVIERTWKVQSQAVNDRDGAVQYLFA